jgi:hypothetical protein
VIRTALALLLAAVPYGPQPEPYHDPPFTCEVIDYGADPPSIPAPEDDPLCVRYDKTNITVSTLGVVDFLAAEPGRIAVVAGKCSYWQQDHWIVRAAPEATPLVEWEGSYWYDGRSGTAGGIVRNMRVSGQPADGEAFATAMEPLIGEEAAAQLAAYAAEGGGGGAAFALPRGFGDGVCPTTAAPGTTGSDPATDGGSPTEDDLPSGTSAGTLAATGRSDGALLLAAVAFLIGLALRRVRAG